MAFPKVEAQGTPGTEAEGSPGGGTRSHAEAGGRSGGPATSFPPRRTAAAAARWATFSLPGAVPAEPGQPLSGNGEGRRVFSATSSRSETSDSRLPSASGARPDPLPHCFLPPASRRRRPSFCVPAALAPSRRSTRGPRGRGRCSPTGVWVLKLLSPFGGRGVSRGPPPTRRRPKSQAGVPVLPAPLGAQGWPETPHQESGGSRNGTRGPRAPARAFAKK